MKRWWFIKNGQQNPEQGNRPRNNRMKKRVIIGISTATAAAVAGTCIYTFGRKTSVRADSESSVQEAEAQTGTVENTITGTGTLQSGTGSSVTVPEGLTYTEVCVESGDTVSKGDTLAKVDHNSVLTAKSNVQTQIDAIDEELAALADGESQTVTSGVAGTVTAVYGAADDSVSDVMKENGAVLEIAVGGDTGNIIQVTAADGKLDSVSVSAGDTVSVGDTLFTLTVGTDSDQYQELLEQREELTEELQELTEIGETDTITATEDGTIGEVNITADTGSSSGTSGTAQTSGTSGTSNTTATPASYTTAVLTDAEDTSAESADTVLDLSFDIGTSLTAPSAGASAVTSLPENSCYTSELVWTTTADLQDGDDTNNTAVTSFQAGTAYSASIRLTAEDGYSFGQISFTDVPDGVTWQYQTDGSTCTITVNYPAVSGTESASGGSGTGSQSSGQNTQNSSGTESGSSASSSGSDGTAENAGNSGASSTSGQGGEAGQASSGNGTAQSGSSAGTAAGSAGSAQISSGSGSGSGSSAASETTGTSSASEDSTDSSETDTSVNRETAFTMADEDTMTISVSVDELDINSVSEGQEAEVTVDAIDGQTFTGTVTSVSNTASSSGNGSAKYVVEISVPKDSSMKEGMSASATIVVESSENVVTIPVNALQEKGCSSYVYTSVDADGNLSGETEVQTGLSDGDTVEITEGLSDGDTVYYEKTGNTSSSDSGQQGGMGGGTAPSGDGGGMPSGDMPSGGGMPSGDNSGGPSGGTGGQQNG